MSITIHTGSILDSKADCIVNPANGFLNHNGGLARIINEAAIRPWEHGDLERFTVPIDSGKSPIALMRAEKNAHDAKIKSYEDDHADAPLIATGGVHATSAGVLPFKAIIHAVGPIWGGGEYLESSLLASAHQRACWLAHHKDFKSIAFPAISCGIFGYPADEAAMMAMSVARRWSHLLDIEFYPFGFEHEYEAAKHSWPDSRSLHSANKPL